MGGLSRIFPTPHSQTPPLSSFSHAQPECFWRTQEHPCFLFFSYSWPPGIPWDSPSFGSLSIGPPPCKSLHKPLKKPQKRTKHRMASQGTQGKIFLELKHTFAEYSLSTSHAPPIDPSFLFSCIKILGQVNFKRTNSKKWQ